MDIHFYSQESFIQISEWSPHPHGLVLRCSTSWRARSFRRRWSPTAARRGQWPALMKHGWTCWKIYLYPQFILNFSFFFFKESLMEFGSLEFGWVAGGLKRIVERILLWCAVYVNVQDFSAAFIKQMLGHCLSNWFQHDNQITLYGGFLKWGIPKSPWVSLLKWSSMTQMIWAPSACRIGDPINESVEMVDPTWTPRSQRHVLW